MAQSNRDRINTGFEILADALNRFLTRVVRIDDNSTWIDILELTDSQRSGSRGRQDYSAEDPQCSLRFITEGTTHRFRNGWRPLSDKLTRSEEALASELRETRNLWAHNAKFTDDDAFRALDTMCRLATAVKDTNAAEKLAAQRNGVRIIQERKVEAQTSHSAEINITGENLQPWREIVTPHPDVANGTFNASAFAADLRTVAGLTNNHRRPSGRHAVVTEESTAPVSSGPEYTDPQLFFDRTYLTEGLRDLLTKTLNRVTGADDASPIINLQTNFGGGKTHSMLAVWHLFGGLDVNLLPQDMQDLLDGSEIPTAVNRVALVGTDLVPSGGMVKPDGTVVNTIWGELAWQLGGAEAYEIVKEADRTATSPGTKLRDLLATFGPAVILIDEWVAYARQLVNRTDLAAGNLSTQATFAQTLSEAVSATPHCMLLVSIPASNEMRPGQYVDGMLDDEEVGGADGREALTTLLQVINRKAEQWRPAEANESFEIVRRRIFREVDAENQEKIRVIAATMRTFYTKHAASFPVEAARPDYQSKIERCYPIHPELFDRLYQDWAALPRFQRTRGVLRLMSTIVSALWRGENNSPLILPSDVPVGTASVANELTQYLDDNWKSIISTDVDGTVPRAIDDNSPILGSRHVAARLARTVFLGSAPRDRGTGIDERRIALGTAVPGDKIGNFHTGLTALANQSTRFYENGSEYWFDTTANITSVVRDRADALTAEDVHREISDRLRAHADSWNRRNNASVKVINSPVSTGDILDSEDLRLVIVPPSDPVDGNGALGAAGEWARSATNNVGLKPRTYKNTVVFLAADARRIEALGDGVRQYLAWSSVRDDADTLDLTVSTINQAKAQAEKLNRTVDDRIADSYQWVIEPGVSTDSSEGFVSLTQEKITSGSNTIQRAVDKLQQSEAFVNQLAPARIAMELTNHTNGAWAEQGHYNLGDLWGMYPRYLYMQRVLNRRVIEDGIRDDGGTFNLNDRPFALADGVAGEAGEDSVLRYVNLRWPEGDSMLPGGSLPDSLLIVHPDAARTQFQVEVAEREAHEAVEAARPADAAGQPGADYGAGLGGNNSGAGDEEGNIGNQSGAGGTGEISGGGTGGGTPPPPGLGQRKSRFTATFELPVSGGGPGLYMRIDDEILHHFRSLESSGGSVRVTVDVEATAKDGFDGKVCDMIDGSIAEMKGAEGTFE